MMERDLILALDQGTTSSRTVAFDHSGQIVAVAQREIAQHYPQPGWVEHDAEEIWKSQLATLREVLAQVGRERVGAIGITNQRETTVVWERATGKPVHRAIVWQDRRTAEKCAALREDGHFENKVSRMTGLRLDPYFSGTKLAWILDQDPKLAARARDGELCFGTIDSWLIWNLTGGEIHATDASNASRTLLYDIHEGCWSQELIEAFGVFEAMLPEVRDSVGDYGSWEGIPITGVAGDQQAALFGQGCFESGMAKNTYGTGCFLLLNTGEEAVPSQNGLLTTVAWQREGVRTYALEGSVFIGGAVVQWLRDEMKMISASEEAETYAREVEDTGGLVLVPAFAGLGAPHWDPQARGIAIGMTRGTGRAHFCRAALESIAFQSGELLDAMVKDSGVELLALKVDGGAVRSDLLMQLQADLSQTCVLRPATVESTALGAACLAGLGVGFWKNEEELRGLLAVAREFVPEATPEEIAPRWKEWQRAVKLAMEGPAME
jgi:glycerol kinase